MIVCGVDIKAREAILALVKTDSDEFQHVKCATKKLNLSDDRDAKCLTAFQTAITAFAHENNVECFVIKSRQANGKMAAGGVTFKIETLIQLAGTPCQFVSPLTLAKFAKGNAGALPHSVLAYQGDAYRAGAWHLNK